MLPFPNPFNGYDNLGLVNKQIHIFATYYTALAPVANFTATPLKGRAPLSVQFTDTSTNTPTSWTWSFGDGAVSNDQNPVHIFRSGGTPDVSLTATNAAGSDTETKTDYLNILSPANSHFWLGVSPIVPPVGTDYTQDPNCTGAWLMTANGGDEPDVSVNGRTLTETSGTIPTSADVPTGYSGTSRDFELGDTEYLEFGGDPDLILPSGANQKVSASFWYKPESLSGSYRYIMSRNGAAGNRCFRVFDGDSNKLTAVMSGDGTSETSAKSNTSLVAGTWSHWTVVYDDVNISIYLNGVLDTGANNPRSYTAGLYDSTSSFVVGNADGRITEVATFSDALTADEVLDIYQHGLKGTYNR